MDMQLENFTDVLDDVIDDSQPLSLSSEDETPCVNASSKSQQKLQNNVSRPPKGTGQHGQFRSVDEVDPKYRGVFTYPFFNLVQSSVIDDALYSDKSMVVCAPTGSGKTVIFEMAIVQLLMEIDDKKYTDDYKIIYMAPVKSLCTERLTEWYPKFTKLGLMCIEVTGDTDVDFSQLKPYRIIITTPEKWDMLTRRWRDHRNLVEMIKLFLIDEVHILNDITRGPVLEAVVSRMKTIETSAQSAHKLEKLQNEYQGASIATKVTPPRIRFVAVSATVGNPEDVATWLGVSEKPAVYYKFGDESRPVKLKRVVEGYYCQEGMSIFKFDLLLNYKLWPIIQKYHNGKPTLIFCNTRKSVTLTAETLSKELTINFNPEQRARLAALASSIKNKKLQTLLLNGVGCHHAGLLFEERTIIEKAFRNRDLPILITTTTLAMGVNLPAHLVIIKNTQQYVNGAYQEYSISTVLQMVGRAGRPQYDTEATAVIMTTHKNKQRYQALVGGSEPLQSYLHKRLAENLNSEAALGTVGDVAQCVQWLCSTFLYVRAGRDPKRYLGLPQNAPQQLISNKIKELCMKAINGLASSGMIILDKACCIQATEAGRLMSIYYLDFGTMKHIMKIEGSETLERLLWIICESDELADMHLRVDERRSLNTLNRNNAERTIRFPMKGKITTRQMKLNCIIQAVLGCIPIPDPSLTQESMKIMRIADRVCKCLVAYVTRTDLVSQQPKFYSAVLNSLILAKCVAAQLWENSPFVSKQLKGIGLTLSNLLATAGKINFMLLEESHPRDLERIINKGPPIGNVLHKQFTLLPKYQLRVTTIDQNSVSVQLFLLNQAYLSENLDQLTAGVNHKCYIVVGDSDNNLLLMTSFKDKDLISVYDGSITYQITRKHYFEHKIFVHCISSNYVGIDTQCEHLFESLKPHSLDTNISNIDINIPKKPANKQTTITDIFKERKRRSNSNITPSKEKKQKNNTVMEKLDYFKERFISNTSKKLNDEKYKIEKPSNEIVNPFMESNNSNAIINTWNNKNTCYNVNNDVKTDTNSTKNIEEICGDDFSDEGNVDSILKEIENEMFESDINNKKDNIPTNKLIYTTVDNTYKNLSSNIIHNTVTSYNTDKNYKMSKKVPTGKNQRKSNTGLNYNFINLSDKNENFREDEEAASSNNNLSFSETIKSRLNNYFKNSYNHTDVSNVQVKELIYEPEELSLQTDSFEQKSTVKDNQLEKENTTGGDNSSYKTEDNYNMTNSRDKKACALNTINKFQHNVSLNSDININKELFLIPERKRCAVDEMLSKVYSPDKLNATNTIPLRHKVSDKENLLSNFENNLLMNNPSILNLQFNETLNVNSELQVTDRPVYSIPRNENHKHLKESPVETKILKSTPESFSSFESGLENKNTRKYSYSMTNKNSFTKNISNRYVTITRKLKVDIDVTEIITEKNVENKQVHISTNKNCIKDIVESDKYTCIEDPQNIRSDNMEVNILNTQEKKIKTETNIIKNETPNNFKINERIENKPENKDISEDEHIPEEKNVAYTLNKYSNILRKKTESTHHHSSINCSNNERPQSQIAKPKRPFKISQIQNINISLPNSLVHDSKIAVHKEKVSPSKTITALNMSTIELSDVMEDKSSNCQFPITQNMESIENIQIDQLMFDPKALLQTITLENINELIIPPPPNFHANNTDTSNVDLGKHSNDIKKLEISDDNFDLMKESFKSSYLFEKDKPNKNLDTNSSNKRYDYEIQNLPSCVHFLQQFRNVSKKKS